MKEIKNNKIFLFIIIFEIIFLTVLKAQNYHIIIYLKNGKEIHGTLISFSQHGIKLDPDGMVSFRYINNKKITSVYVKELDKNLNVPLKQSDFPKGFISKEKKIYHGNFEKQQFLFHFSFGPITSSGEYYSGFSSGTAFHLEGYYVFDHDEIAYPRMFIGFSIYHSSIDGETISDYDYSNYSYSTKLGVMHYGFDFGVMTSSWHKSYYFYGILGIVIINNKFSVQGHLTQIEISANDAIGGARFGVGFVKGITSKFGIVVSGDIDFVFSGTYTNEYGNEAPAAVGMLPNFAIGIVYGL